MRSLVLSSLQRAIDPSVVSDLLETHDKLMAEFRKGDAEAALNASGKFVEHVLRGLEGLRTGAAPKEIKSVAAAIKSIEADASLPESLRILVPRIAGAMLFDVRSKRGAAHVKEISPRKIDASFAVHAASWILAELLRLYHTADESAVAEAMATLVRGNLPLIEKFGDEIVVTTPLPSDTEILLMIAEAEPNGIDRTGLGLCVKHSPSAITRALQRLDGQRYIHKTKAGAFHITGPGEAELVTRLAALGAATVISPRSAH